MRGFGGAATMPLSTEWRISMPKPKDQRKPPKSRKSEIALKATAQAKADRITPAKKTEAESKQDRLVSMLRSPTGTTIATMMTATGWQQHSVRGFLAGVVRKRLKLKLQSETSEGNRIYRIIDAGMVKASTERTKRRAR
jgi:outer membrane biosynthesis protein TonB